MRNFPVFSSLSLSLLFYSLHSHRVYDVNYVRNMICALCVDCGMNRAIHFCHIHDSIWYLYSLIISIAMAFFSLLFVCLTGVVLYL